MVSHPRIRKTVKWAGAVITLVLIATWIGSAWFDFEWSKMPSGQKPEPWVHAGAGVIVIGQNEHHSSGVVIATGPLLERASSVRFSLRMSWNRVRGFWWVSIPIWIIAAIFLIPTAIAWRLDALARRHSRANACAACGYPRVGLPAMAPCPECGPLGKS